MIDERTDGDDDPLASRTSVVGNLSHKLILIIVTKLAFVRFVCLYARLSWMRAPLESTHIRISVPSQPYEYTSSMFRTHTRRRWCAYHYFSVLFSFH